MLSRTRLRVSFRQRDSQMHSPSAKPTVLSEFQLDPVAERFFIRSGEDGLEDTPAPALSHGNRRAMRATFAMLGVFSLALIGFVIYARVIMPVPAELGGDYGVTLPEAALSTPE